VKQFIAWLAVVAIIPVAALGSYALGSSLAPDSSVQAQPKTHWIYGPRQTYQAGKLLVYCQSKTNSRAFGNHVKAKPGDVVIETCRAVKDPRGKTPPSPGA